MRRAQRLFVKAASVPSVRDGGSDACDLADTANREVPVVSAVCEGREHERRHQG